jgi:hypothetical protein
MKFLQPRFPLFAFSLGAILLLTLVEACSVLAFNSGGPPPIPPCPKQRPGEPYLLDPFGGNHKWDP